MQNGAPLPDWMEFDSQARKITGMPPKGSRELNLRVIAQGPEARASDSFILRIDASAAGAKSSALPISEKAPTSSAKSSAAQPTASPKPIASDGIAKRFVQAKALTSRSEAQAFANEIKRRVGMQAFVRKTEKRNPPLYRVIIPAFSNQDIRPIQQNLEIMGVTDSFVVRK